MIKSKDSLRLERLPCLKGGRGETHVIHFMEEAESKGLGRLFGISILPVGSSIGLHTHMGDFETYYILEGRARVNDNGEVQELNPGDVMICEDGHSHSIENIGNSELKYVALIHYTN